MPRNARLSLPQAPQQEVDRCMDGALDAFLPLSSLPLQTSSCLIFGHRLAISLDLRRRKMPTVGLKYPSSWLDLGSTCPEVQSLGSFRLRHVGSAEPSSSLGSEAHQPHLGGEPTCMTVAISGSIWSRSSSSICSSSSKVRRVAPSRRSNLQFGSARVPRTRSLHPDLQERR